VKALILEDKQKLV